MEARNKNSIAEKIRSAYGIRRVEWRKSIPVTDRFGDSIAWDGVVEEFEVLDHATARTAYGWISSQESGAEKIVVVLAIQPVRTALDAVRASVIAEYRAKNPKP